jgi:hypothetical protein
MTEPHSGSSHALGMRPFFSSLVILALAGAVGYLLSEKNSRRYFIHYEGGVAIVERGLLLPMGHAPYRPKDPTLAKAYAPFRLRAGARESSASQPAEDESFDDRADLDRRVCELLIDAARAQLATSEPAHLEPGIALLDRAELLREIAPEQAQSLRALRSEVAYFQANAEISKALATLQNVRALLRLAVEGNQKHAKESADLLDRLDAPIDLLLRAARGASLLPVEAVPATAPSPALDGG